MVTSYMQNNHNSCGFAVDVPYPQLFKLWICIMVVGWFVVGPEKHYCGMKGVNYS